jgi:hypothetical protein
MDTKKNTFEPMKNPFVLFFIAFTLSVIIGTVFYMMKIQQVNFLLFCSLVAGMAYAASYDKVMPKILCFKTAVLYFAFMSFVLSGIYFYKPSLLNGMEYKLTQLFSIMVPLEAVIFGMLLRLGSKILVSNTTAQKI